MTQVTVAQAVPLKGIPDVELLAQGTWEASTGKAVITSGDLKAALGALDCPGVYHPVLKLGHQEPDPDAETKIRWDGEPAVGWVSNMRLSDNGAKLLGDYTGMPGWLADVCASAYPRRSAEIQRNMKCQIGHTHPVVITAISLLGVTPPAVGVLRSLNDVQALYTLAAADGNPPGEVTASIASHLAATPPAAPRRPLTPAEQASQADFARDHAEWEGAVAALMKAYGPVQKAQRQQLSAQIAPLIDSGRYDALSTVSVDDTQATNLIYAEMLTAAQAAIALQIAEAAAQGVTGLTAYPDEFYLRDLAAGIAGSMASSLSATAGRNAAQLAAPGATGESVAQTVDRKLSDLSDRFLRDQFAGAVGAARASGRHSVLSVAPDGSYYAAEVNDDNTCHNCEVEDGTRFPTLDAAMAAYGAGGYRLCSGGSRCRGRLVAVWKVDTEPVPLPVPAMASFAVRVGDHLHFAKAANVPGKGNAKQLKAYWLRGEGLAKWETWTQLYHHLQKYIADPDEAKRTAASWFHERYGFWPGDKKNDTGGGKKEKASIVLRVGDRVLFAEVALKFDPTEVRDPDGKWTDGPGGASAAGSAAAGLLAGRKVNVSAADLPDMLTTLADAKAVNLSRMQVTGEPNLFRKHARNIPRSEMPQLPTKTHEMGAFTDALAERGLKGKMEEVDPRTLTATQNELDSAKVGQMFARAKAGTLNRDAVAFISRDGEILDGHHRWAALAAAQATGTEATMKVIRVDTDIDTLLDVANSVSGPRKTVGAPA